MQTEHRRCDRHRGAMYAVNPERKAEGRHRSRRHLSDPHSTPTYSITNVGVLLGENNF